MKPHVFGGQRTQPGFQQSENILHLSAVTKPAHAHIMKARRFLSAHWDCPCGLAAFRILTGICSNWQEAALLATIRNRRGLCHFVRRWRHCLIRIIHEWTVSWQKYAFKAIGLARLPVCHPARQCRGPAMVPRHTAIENMVLAVAANPATYYRPSPYNAKP